MVSYDLLTVFRLCVCCRQITRWSILIYCIWRRKKHNDGRRTSNNETETSLHGCSCPVLLCNLICSQFWTGLSSVAYPCLLLLSVPSIHCHHPTQRTRSSRPSRCSSRGSCPDAVFALTTVVWTAAVAPSVWAEPAGAAPGECLVRRTQFYCWLWFLFLFFLFFTPFPLPPSGCQSLAARRASPCPAPSLSSAAPLANRALSHSTTAAFIARPLTPPSCPPCWMSLPSRSTHWSTPSGVKTCSSLFNLSLLFFLFTDYLNSWRCSTLKYI